MPFAGICSLTELPVHWTRRLSCNMWAGIKIPYLSIRIKREPCTPLVSDWSIGSLYHRLSFLVISRGLCARVFDVKFWFVSFSSLICKQDECRALWAFLCQMDSHCVTIAVTIIIFILIFLAYRNWMNSLGVDPFVNHLYHDLSNGYILFQVG